MTLLLQPLEASRTKNWTEGRVFTDERCTNLVITDVSGFRLHLSTGWNDPEKDNLWANLSTVIYTYFMMEVENVHIYFTIISSVCTYCFQKAHWFHSVKHFFYLLQVYIFLLKQPIGVIFAVLDILFSGFPILRWQGNGRFCRHHLYEPPHDNCSY